MSSIRELLKRNAKSTELPAGIHSNVHLIKVEIDDRKDNSGNRIKKQLFLTFKKVDEEGNVVGEKEISFFDIDPVKEYALDNLHTYIVSVKSILETFVSEKVIEKRFDPLKVLLEKDEDVDESSAEFKFDNIKKARLKKMSTYKKIEEAVRAQFYAIVKSKIGYDSVSLRLKLEYNKNNSVHIPRYGHFIERDSVNKKESKLISKLN